MGKAGNKSFNMQSVKSDIFSVWQLTVRSIKLFFKDPWSVFFTFMGPLIIVFIYLGFLRDIQINNAVSFFPEGFEINRKTLGGFVDLWMFASVIGVSCMTAALNGLAYIVYDKENGVTKDFLVSPVKPSIITLGYAFAAFATTLMIIGLLVIFCSIYIAATGFFTMSAAEYFTLWGLVILACLSAVIVLMPLVALFKSASASGAFNGIFSGVIGFVTGAYMPISTFALGIQYVSSLLPGSHAAGLFRNIMMESALPKITEGMPAEVAEMVASGMKQWFSFDINMFGTNVGADIMWVYLASSVVVFFIINIILERVKKRKMYI